MKRIFGVKHAGVYFETLVVIEDGCFYYKNKRYAWENIIAVKRGDDLLSTFMRYPSTTVLLSDGIVLRIPVTLQEKDVHDRIRFVPFNYKTKSYDELIDILEKHSATSGTLSQPLYSYNYIMVYRWLITIGFVFGAFLLFVIFGLRLKFDFVMTFITVLQVIAMGMGIFLLGNRHLRESKTKKELRHDDEKRSDVEGRS